MWSDARTPHDGRVPAYGRRENEHATDYLVKQWKGPAYLRLTRQALPDLYPEGRRFDPLKLMEVLPAGGAPEVICIASGRCGGRGR